MCGTVIGDMVCANMDYLLAYGEAFIIFMSVWIIARNFFSRETNGDCISYDNCEYANI